MPPHNYNIFIFLTSWVLNAIHEDYFSFSRLMSPLFQQKCLFLPITLWFFSRTNTDDAVHIYIYFRFAMLILIYFDWKQGNWNKIITYFIYSFIYNLKAFHHLMKAECMLSSFIKSKYELPKTISTHKKTQKYTTES